MFDRRQRNRESVRELLRALLEISEGISDKLQSKNEMVIEVFCENLVDIHIKREMKRLVRGQSTISFSALRSEAIRLEGDGWVVLMRMHVSGEFRSLTIPQANLVHWTESQHNYNYLQQLSRKLFLCYDYNSRRQWVW